LNLKIDYFASYHVVAADVDDDDDDGDDLISTNDSMIDYYLILCDN
jgi:hypothetical protein